MQEGLPRDRDPQLRLYPAAHNQRSGGGSAVAQADTEDIPDGLCEIGADGGSIR
jgi:hypothetical protein